MRTDENRNPSAFTVDIAKQAGLILGIDYAEGTPFPRPSRLVTAEILGDPIDVTIRVIDAIGYYTQAGKPRWDYIALPKWLWDGLSLAGKRDVIGFHYQREGGTTMRAYFPQYGRP